MELRELTTFQAVGQTLNFTRAADMLGYAQSTVTAQIQSLEADLGVPLFNRFGRHISLTEAGTRLLAYAHRITSLCAEAREVATSTLVHSGTITLSASESVCTYRLPSILHAFRAAWPTVHVVFQPMPVAEMYTALRDGIIDLVLLLERPKPLADLESVMLSEEPICLLVSPNHQLSASSVLTAEALQPESFLLTERGCAYRAEFEQALSALGVRTPTTLEFASVEAIKQCAIAGLGLAYLPQMSVAYELAARRLVTLPWTPTQLSLQLAWHKEKWLSPAVQAFVEICQQVYCPNAD